jgi:hypothetical protein
VDATEGIVSPPLAPCRMPLRRPLTMITYTITCQLNWKHYNQNHINESRSDPKLPIEPCSNTTCNDPFVMTMRKEEVKNPFFSLGEKAMTKIF